MKIQWEHYHSPNIEERDEIQLMLERLIEEQNDEDEFLMALYNELLPNIKHQYRIYEIAIPIMDWFEDLLTKHPNFPRKIDILDFFGHIFSEHIRESLGILTSPSTYDYASKNLKDYDPAENDFFIRFKMFHLSLFSGIFPEKETRSIIMYDLCFIEDFMEKYSAAHLKTNNSTILFDIYIAIGMYKKFQQKQTTHQVNVEISEKIENKDLIFAINGCEFDEEKLKKIIKQNDVIESIWGHGFLTVIGADSLLLYSQNKNDNALCEAIDFICEVYTTVSENEGDSEADFPCHKFLMEDVSSILFRKNLGSQKKLQTEDLTYPQKHFFLKLSEQLKIHTNSMLHAGLLPKGGHEKELLAIDDIYDYYNR